MKGDWVNEVKKIIESLNLKLSFNEIKNTKKNKFKNLIKGAVQNKAMKYLKAKQQKKVAKAKK